MENKNIALIFAGGTGQRMNSKGTPKQFLELHGKPIIIYTLEIFEKNSYIDSIIVVCLESWMDYLEQLIIKYDLKKVVKIISGGRTAQESQYLGLQAVKKYINPSDDSTILIHDGVRPLIDDDTIMRNIESVKKYGNAITSTPAIETVVIAEEDHLVETLDRSKLKIAKAPQSFRYSTILGAHEKAIADNKQFIDSATLMQYYGEKLHIVEGCPENIKITTPTDFYIFRAIVDKRENSQILGI